MSKDSIFFRAPDARIIQELKNRYNGKTVIRHPSSKAAGGSSINRQSYCEIYSLPTNTLLLVTGNVSRVRKGIKYKANNQSAPIQAYKVEAIELSQGGTYGHLNSIMFAFKLNPKQPEKYTAEFDELFTRVEDAFSVGREIKVKFGYEKSSIPGIHDSDEHEYIFRIHKPQYTIGAGMEKGGIKFKVEGLGAASSTAVEQDVRRLDFSTLVGKQLRGQSQNIWKDKDGRFTYTTDYTATGDDRYSTVEGIIDWINFDVQSHAHLQREDSSKFDLSNGDSVIGRHPIPPIAKLLDPNADYKNVGFVTFNTDEDYYTSKYQIDDNTWFTGYVYYVTLQYLVWLFNWTLQAKSAEISIAGKKIKTLPLNSSPSWRRQLRKNGVTNVNKFYIKCDGRTTTGNLVYKDKDDKELFIPSTDPWAVLFAYGSKTSDPDLTANYGFSTFIPETQGSYSPYGYQAGSPSRTVQTDVIKFAGDTGAPNDLQVCEMGKMYNSPKGRGGTQNAFSLQDGDLSKILINKDLLAGILDELGGLTTTITKVDEDVSKSTIGKFFGKLFQVIKNASGGAIDLSLVPDPDTSKQKMEGYDSQNQYIDEFTDVLLIKNANEKVESKAKIPIFNKRDGSKSEFSLQSKIPKASQAAAFGGQKGPTNESGAVKIVNEINEPDTKPSVEKPEATKANLIEAKSAMNRSKYSADSVQAFTGMLKEIVNIQDPAEQITKRLSIFPLELSLDFLGINGFKFGDTVSTGQLPPKYRTEITKGSANAKVGFTVTKVNHTFKGKSWRTSLDAVCRILPSTAITEEIKITS